MGQDKICSKGQDKIRNFCSSLNHRTTFCSQYNYKKYENTLFIFKYEKIISLSLFDIILSCPVPSYFVLYYLVLSCTVLSSTYYFANDFVRLYRFYEILRDFFSKEFLQSRFERIC
jgi:hypothetical protein